MTAGAILLLVLVTGWVWHKHSREKWARESAEPEIVRLLDAGDYPRAAALALEASSALPGDLTIKTSGYAQPERFPSKLSLLARTLTTAHTSVIPTLGSGSDERR